MQTEQPALTGPEYPRVEDDGNYDMVIMPASWPLGPVYDECRARGLQIVGHKKRRGFWRIKVTKGAA